MAFTFSNNLLTDNSATKALLYLDFNDRRTTSSRTIISGNTFQRAGTYFEGGAIYIRARSTSNVLAAATISAEALYPCGGYAFRSNYFETIIGCPGYSGSVIKFMCINNANTADVAYNDRYNKNDALTIASPALAAMTDDFNQLLFENN